MPVARATWLDPRGPAALLATLCRPEVAAAWQCSPDTPDLADAIARALPGWVSERPDVVDFAAAVLAGDATTSAPFPELEARAVALRQGDEVRLTWQLVAATAPHLPFVPPLLSVLLGRCDDAQVVAMAQAAGLHPDDAHHARDLLYRALRNPDGVRALLTRLPDDAFALVSLLAGRHGRPVADHPQLAVLRRCGLVLPYAGTSAVTLPLETAHAVHLVLADHLHDEARRVLACAWDEAPLALPLPDRRFHHDQLTLSVLLGPLDPTRRAAAEVFGMDCAIGLLSRVDGVFGPLPAEDFAARDVARAREVAARAGTWLDRFQLRVLEGLAALPPGRALTVHSLARYACTVAAWVAADLAEGREDLAAASEPLCWRGAGELAAMPSEDDACAYARSLLDLLEHVGLARCDGDSAAVDTRAVGMALARLHEGLRGRVCQR